MHLHDKNDEILFRLVIFGLFILFVPACGKQQSQTVSNLAPANAQVTIPEAVFLSETRYDDIPIPKGFENISVTDLDTTITSSAQQSSTPNSELFSYSGPRNVDQITTFYRKNMELYGWAIVDFSTNQESLLLCNKINRLCGISIRPQTIGSKNKNETMVCLFVQEREEEELERKGVNTNTQELEVVA